MQELTEDVYSIYHLKVEAVFAPDNVKSFVVPVDVPYIEKEASNAVPATTRLSTNAVSLSCTAPMDLSVNEAQSDHPREIQKPSTLPSRRRMAPTATSPPAAAAPLPTPPARPPPARPPNTTISVNAIMAVQPVQFDPRLPMPNHAPIAPNPVYTPPTPVYLNALRPKDISELRPHHPHDNDSRLFEPPPQYYTPLYLPQSHGIVPNSAPAPREPLPAEMSRSNYQPFTSGYTDANIMGPSQPFPAMPWGYNPYMRVPSNPMSHYLNYNIPHYPDCSAPHHPEQFTIFNAAKSGFHKAFQP